MSTRQFIHTVLQTMRVSNRVDPNERFNLGKTLPFNMRIALIIRIALRTTVHRFAMIG